MGVKKFFKKIGSGIKKAASWTKDKFHKTANVVKKFGKPILNIAEKASGLLQMVPGKVGMVATAVNTGAGVANKILDQIPAGAAKNKLQSAQQNVLTKTSNVLNKGMSIAEKAADYGQRAQNVIGIVNGLR